MRFSIAVCLMFLLTALVGCRPGATSDNNTAEAAAKAQDHAKHDHDGHEHPANPDANRQADAETTVTPLEHSVDLIPRKSFFGNPQRARARISPDGSKLGFLAPREGVLNVWVAPATDVNNAKPVTNDTHRGIRSFSWAYTSNHLLYSQDKDGDEDFHLYSVNLETDEIKDLTPLENVSAQVDTISEKFPEEILVGINDRPPHQLHDLYRVNIVTGERTLVQLNPGFAGFVTDDDFAIRFAATYTPDGGQMYLEPKASEGSDDPGAETADAQDADNADAADDQDADKSTSDDSPLANWQPFLTIGPIDAMTTGLSGFDKTNKKAYFIDSRDRNTAALKLWDLDTGEMELLAENDLADISGAIAHPTEKHIQAVFFTHARREWKILDPSIQPDLDYLKTVADGEIQLTSRTLKDDLWTVAYTMDDGPVDFYLYDRTNKKATFLFTSDPELKQLPLVHMHDVIIKSRDGMDLVSYLSLPPGSDPTNVGRPQKPVPLVLNVHGGPWARDRWGYDPLHQMLANRGYACLSVNYRGSTGLGKDFTNAANREWAGKMHEDLVDAVNWAIAEQIAMANKVAIMGGSYGGYATLVGLTFTPDLFACGIDVVGPSSLITLLENPPPYWMPFMPVLKYRVGDHENEEDRKFLESRSPLFFVDRIKKPLLIAQGAQDPRVKQAEADQIVAAMREKNIPVTYLLYPEEGHGFARPENRFAYYAVAEAFLAENLGGRYEPIGDAFNGAVLEIPEGRDQVPGLAEALQ